MRMPDPTRLAWIAVGFATGFAFAADAPPVTLAQDSGAFVLDNGALVVRIDQRTGRLQRITYRQLELLDRRSSTASNGGYWSLPGTRLDFGLQVQPRIIVDPNSNHGDRAIVSSRFTYDRGPSTVPFDVEFCYSLARGQDALFAYSVWHHKPGYPAFALGVGRFALKLNPDVFDFMTIDANRRRLMPTPGDWNQGTELNLKEARRLTTGRYAGTVEHKYDYAAAFFETPAYGWSSTRENVGFWLINPSIEYIAGGPTKVELTAHLDGHNPGFPTLLNVWKGPHFGGTSLVVRADETWTKLIGPFVLYCNRAPDQDALWHDALAQAAREQQAWPYAWLDHPAYPPRAARGSVAGRIELTDPLVKPSDLRDLCVGLSAPDYTITEPNGTATNVDWQREGRDYQFWVRATTEGGFEIPNVRPGTYMLHAFATGVLGEFARADVRVVAGQHVELGDLIWSPERHGRQIWEIGVPDRTAREFRHGDHYWQWGLYNEYPKEFPHDVNFVIGRSDWRRDWNYVQPPRLDGNRVTSTTWSIEFELPSAERGQAFLRLAIAGSRVKKGIEVAVNGHAIGGTGPLPETGTMHRDGIRGYWCERDVVFDAALLRAGRNVITLHVPATQWTNGVLYDYLRLELADAGALPAARHPSPGR